MRRVLRVKEVRTPNVLSRTGNTILRNVRKTRRTFLVEYRISTHWTINLRKQITTSCNLIWTIWLPIPRAQENSSEPNDDNFHKDRNFFVKFLTFTIWSIFVQTIKLHDVKKEKISKPLPYLSASLDSDFFIPEKQDGRCSILPANPCKRWP